MPRDGKNEQDLDINRDEADERKTHPALFYTRSSVDSSWEDIAEHFYFSHRRELR